MTTLYIVTSGSYSDYSINHVFSTQTAAEAVAAKIYEARVEEYPLDPDMEPFKVTRVSMLRDGTATLIEQEYSNYKREPYVDGEHGVWVFKFDANGHDEAQAVKAANEARAALIAAGGWPTGPVPTSMADIWRASHRAMLEARQGPGN